MKIHYIKKLISEGEHQQLDFKFEISDSRKIARTLVAFANTDGGKLLIGVKDNGIIAGIRSEEEIFMLQAAAELYSKPPIEYSFVEWEIENKTILEIIVPKSQNVPHYSEVEAGKWLVFIRVNDQNLLANKILLRVWEREKKNQSTFIRFSDKEKMLFEYLDKNKIITFSKFCRIAEISHIKAENILVNLIALQLLDIVFEEKSTYYRLKNQE